MDKVLEGKLLSRWGFSLNGDRSVAYLPDLLIMMVVLEDEKRHTGGARAKSKYRGRATAQGVHLLETLLLKQTLIDAQIIHP